MPKPKKPDPFMIDDENPEWDEAAFAEARPISETNPALLAAWEAKQGARPRGRPFAETPKIHIGFRLAADVVEAVRATGRGYNARVEKVLREAIAKGAL